MRWPVFILALVACGGQATPPAAPPAAARSDRPAAHPAEIAAHLEYSIDRGPPLAPTCRPPADVASRPIADLGGCSEAPLDDGGSACRARWDRAHDHCGAAEAACAGDTDGRSCDRARTACRRLICDACACVSGERWPLTL